MRWPMKTNRILHFLILLLALATAPYLLAEVPQKPKKTQKQIDYAPYPKPGSGYVTDKAGLLTDKAEERIETWLWQIESRSNVEIAVVTIYSIKDYPGTDNGSIESFAKGLFNKYGIGNLPKNNGILLLVAVKDRKATIELGKFYGDKYDAKAREIMKGVIIPQFKKDRYRAGHSERGQGHYQRLCRLPGGLPLDDRLHCRGHCCGCAHRLQFIQKRQTRLGLGLCGNTDCAGIDPDQDGLDDHQSFAGLREQFLEFRRFRGRLRRGQFRGWRRHRELVKI